MPNCFHLTPKGETSPATLNSIDEAICNHLGVPVHPTQWVHAWYHVIGFLLAMHGDALDSPKLRERIIEWYHADDPEEWRDQQLAILDFLKEHYTSDAWAEIGKGRR